MLSSNNNYYNDTFLSLLFILKIIIVYVCRFFFKLKLNCIMILNMIVVINHNIYDKNDFNWYNALYYYYNIINVSYKKGQYNLQFIGF